MIYSGRGPIPFYIYLDIFLYLSSLTLKIAEPENHIVIRLL